MIIPIKIFHFILSVKVPKAIKKQHLIQDLAVAVALLGTIKVYAEHLSKYVYGVIY